MLCPLWCPYHQPHITCQRDSTLHGLWKDVFFQILAWIQKYNRVHSKGLALPSTRLRLLPARMSHIWVTSPPLMWLTEFTGHIWVTPAPHNTGDWCAVHFTGQVKQGAYHLSCSLQFFKIPVKCTFSGFLTFLNIKLVLVSITWPHIWSRSWSVRELLPPSAKSSPSEDWKEAGQKFSTHLGWLTMNNVSSQPIWSFLWMGG